MEIKNFFDNKNDIIKNIFLIIIIYNILIYIEINLNKVLVLVISSLLIFYYYKYQKIYNKKYETFIKKYNMKINIKENFLLIKYLCDIEYITNKQLFLELIKTLKSLIIYYKMDDIQNTHILMKECLNIHHSMYLKSNEEFNNILNSYTEKLNENINNTKITRHTNLNDNDIETISFNYNNNFEYY